MLYIFFIPAFIWGCVLLVMKCVRSKTLLFVCCLLVCFAYIHTLQVSANAHHHNWDITRTLIFVGALDIVYIILTINFCRAENKAIQTGWDAACEDKLNDANNFTASDNLHDNPNNNAHWHSGSKEIPDAPCDSDQDP